MKQWLISKIPTRVLRYLVKRNYRLRQVGVLRDEWYWADLEISRRDIVLCPNCFNQTDFAERCPFCYPPFLGPKIPFGVPKWFGEEHKSFGESND